MVHCQHPLLLVLLAGFPSLTFSPAKESLGERRDKRHLDQQSEKRLDCGHQCLRITRGERPDKKAPTVELRFARTVCSWSLTEAYFFSIIAEDTNENQEPLKRKDS